MIERVLKIVGLDTKNKRAKLHDCPENKTLNKDRNGKPREQKWNYISAVVCLYYIQAMIRPYITMAAQQGARFCNDPHKYHKESLKRILKYLLKKKEQGITLRLDKTKGLECHVDEDWDGSCQH